MNILYETEKLRIENIYETARLIDKSTGKLLLQDDFYGNPECGLIDRDNQWAIIASYHLTIWTPARWKRLEGGNLKGIHALRIKDSETVEVLTDTWADDSAVWEIHVKSFDFMKVRDFKEYKKRPYSENVIW